ncbi:MAG: hypothetical protein HY785_20675 [Oscillatoriophycideae cyanobacterium NC_groundwater_1537_Pr4_S-0.65um_50_18]|nr:hypothetical protein [Oscillatoriophycideae cyanobacterium NC_groundwater_1537_Pr4_S-0.65um_50_18]
MQVLLVCLVLFFVASELYQWMQGMTLPLPMLIAAGIVLAIASNLRNLSVPSWNAHLFQASATLPTLPEPVVLQSVVPEPVTPELVAPELIAPEPSALKASVQLPNFIS